MPTVSPDFAALGAQRFEGVLGPDMPQLEAALSTVRTHDPGVRLHGLKALEPLLDSVGCIGAIAASVLRQGAAPVRAILFNKSADANWSLGWHQDRMICVKERREAPGFGPWTVKGGRVHVAPPFDLLSRMVTVRAHLDDVPCDNAPLLIAPGSHAFGRIVVEDVDQVVEQCGTATCLATAGDVWLYATPILHASEAARVPTRRRVLQVDYSADALPHGLEWLGV